MKRKYLDRAPRIGDTVEVTNTGMCFSHYRACAERLRLTKWKKGNEFCNTSHDATRLLRVVGISRHDTQDTMVVGVYCPKYDEEYMFRMRGLRVVESIADKLDLI